MPTVDQVAPGNTVDLSGAPAGLDDTTFDSLFPADGMSAVAAPAQPAQTQGTPAATSQPQTASTTPQPDTSSQSSAPFLKGDKSIYNSADAAIKGINEKDAIIEQLRTRYALTTGVDPLTNQPVGQTQQPVNDDYTQNPKKYLDDLYSAAKQGPEAYAAVQSKYIMDTLKPLAPVIQQTVRTQAVEQVAKEIPDAGKFVGSAIYQTTLDTNPQLKQAIATAESDARFHPRLAELYKLAYFAGQGLQMPEILKANAAAKQPQQTTPVTARPTAQPTTLSTATPTTAPSLNTIEGIRAIIKDAEGKGITLGSW